MDEKAPESPPLMTRFRRAFLGRNGASKATAFSAFGNAAQLDAFGKYAEPVALPPVEPADQLPQEVPWELRDDER